MDLSQWTTTDLQITPAEDAERSKRAKLSLPALQLSLPVQYKRFVFPPEKERSCFYVQNLATKTLFL